MIWKSDGKLMPSPSTYKDNIEDTDNDSYSSVVDATLNDNRIACGMVKAEFSFDDLTEEEAEMVLQETYKNPMNLTIKSPSVLGGMLTAKFRCSSRSSEMNTTEASEDATKSYWKVSFNVMQKEMTDEQRALV
jgi:hypothetical protein